jgi:Fur family peroxide stress response transcriptional regulator
MNNIEKILAEHGLKVTPQRIAVLKTLYKIKGHPTVEVIAREVRKKNPHIGMGTIYNVLDILLKKNIIEKVKTDGETMRFELRDERHHHLYCETSDKIEDYYDKQLDELIKGYLESKNIPNFTITDFSIQITGNFNDTKK